MYVPDGFRTSAGEIFVDAFLDVGLFDIWDFYILQRPDVILHDRPVALDRPGWYPVWALGSCWRRGRFLFDRLPHLAYNILNKTAGR